MAQQPHHKGRKRVIFHENHQTTTPTVYNSNLNTAQQELLRLHETYAHADMKETQHQIKNCDLKANRQVALCQIPKCLSCSENKGKKRSHNQHCGSITADNQRPGSNKSIDHVDAANVPGYTWQHKGRPTLKKYKNCMLFVDHKTRLVHPSFQESKTASEACRSKCDYEKFAQRYNVTVDSYHADNGAFRSATCQKDIDKENQKLNFSGINAQWQNGLVERYNGTLCAAARSMINHAISKWDKTITSELWPFSIQQAAIIYNTTKRRSRDYDISPWEQFTGERSKLIQSDMHPLLCPVYVLDRRMQEGTSPPNGQSAQFKKSMLSTFTTTPDQFQWSGILIQSSSHHNFTLCSTIISIPSNLLILTFNITIPWTDYFRIADTHTMILSEMTIHIYSPTGEQTFTQIT
jgi:hypothetical protein